MINAVIQILRPKQWTKNLIIFSGLIFSGNLFNETLLTKSFFAFILFCGLSSSIYIINDIFDLENDRRHPLKCLRPLPSGKIKISLAATLALLLALICLSLSFVLHFYLGIMGAIYFLCFVLYSTFLKHIVILDVS